MSHDHQAATIRMIRILVADDHPVVREGLIALIERQTDMVVPAEASNGHEAVQAFLQHRPDIVLLDLRMPEKDGIETIHTIRRAASDARAAGSRLAPGCST